MCGIAGAAWTTLGSAIGEFDLDRMTDVLHHRGPDGRGCKLFRRQDGSGVGLGHRRLAIIDVDGSPQPMSNEDETIWVTFNGEIYNYSELRRELESKGHRFRTAGDTETIVHLYEELGPNCVSRLRGMFAFAIWDAGKQSLMMARDRLGQKPLVYCTDAHRLSFASEIKSLLTLPGTEFEIDPAALNDYLTYYYIPAPRTIFSGIQKLPPAHYATYERGKLTVTKYWEPDLINESSQSLQESREELAAEIEEAVRLRLRSDVPLGAFLSGGIDSTVVVGLMQRHVNQATRSFTIGFPQASHDESPFAQIAADHLATRHHVSKVIPDGVNVLPQLVHHFDEPFADSSAIPTYYLSQETRSHVTVALTGDGGDELFAGYPRYQTIHGLRWFDGLPSILRRMATSHFWDRLPAGKVGSLSQKVRNRMRVLREDPADRYIHWVGAYSQSDRQSLLRSEVWEQIDNSSTSHLLEAWHRSGRSSPGVKAMHTDLMTYLPGDLLAKVDVCSMAHGLECRSPFLDHHVVELATRLPMKYHVSRRSVKPMLSETFPELLSPTLRNRPKQGFSVPLDHWFRSELREMLQDSLLADNSFCASYLSPTAIRELAAQHENEEQNHGDRLWALLFLEQWGRTYMQQAHETEVSGCV